MLHPFRIHPRQLTPFGVAANGLRMGGVPAEAAPLLLSHQWLCSPQSHHAAVLGREKCAMALPHVFIQRTATVEHDCPVAIHTRTWREFPLRRMPLPHYPSAWWGCRRNGMGPITLRGCTRAGSWRRMVIGCHRQSQWDSDCSALSSAAVGKADGGADHSGRSSTTIGEADGGVDRPTDASPLHTGVGQSSTAIGKADGGVDRPTEASPSHAGGLPPPAPTTCHPSLSGAP